MPTFIRNLTHAGLETMSYTAESLAEAAKYEPDDGVYTVTNTYNTFDTLKLDAHLDRMEDSARRANIPLQLDREHLRAALREMIAEAGFGDVRFRLTVPRQQSDTFIITLEPYTPPSPTLVERGVAVITVANSARKNAGAKTTGWMHLRKTISDSLSDGIYDAILLDEHENLLEGLGANFYAIVDGELYTAGEGVLPGIAQQIVFEIAPSLIRVHRTSVNKSDIPRIEESFITSSSRGIIPVTAIDGHNIGQGKPGPHTLALRSAYVAWVNDHLEPL